MKNSPPSPSLSPTQRTASNTALTASRTVSSRTPFRVPAADRNFRAIARRPRRDTPM